MKKLLTIAFAASAFAAAADSTVAGNEVGVLKVTSSLKNTVVAVPFTELGGGNVCVSNIVKTANLAAGDELYVYSGGAYKAWVLTVGGDSALYWNAVGTASISADGTLPHGSGPAADSTTLAPGNAIWLVRNGTSRDLSVPFYVYGGYTSVSQSVTAGTKSAPAWNLVANPTAAAATPSVASPAKLDMVCVPNGTAVPTKYIYNGSAWQGSAGAGPLPAIAPGQGFWYVSKGGSGAVSWN